MERRPRRIGGTASSPAAAVASCRATFAAVPFTVTVTFTVFVALACATSTASAPRDWAVATTSYGAIRGRPMLSLNGRIFVAFLGVPYARPPLADLRFRAPRPPLPWPGVRDARSHPPVCLQLSSVPGDVIGNEDCLYLNVYTRHVGDAEYAAAAGRGVHRGRSGGGAGRSVPLPVLMWVHGGGGFATGGASAGSGGLGPEVAMDRELVLVVPQFRLGPLGFFSSNDALAPGNYGLKDLVFALRWIRANAPVFGGDPERVTVGGSGSGAALAHLLSLAPSSRALVRSVACIGGSALSPWAFQHDPRPSARALASAVGCLARTAAAAGEVPPLDEHVLQCLQRTTAATLIVAASKFSHWSAVGVGGHSSPSFAPVVERAPTQRPIHGAWLETRFLAEAPERLIRSRAQPPALFAAATGTATLLPTEMLRQPLRAQAAQRRATLRELRDALQRMVVRGVMPRGAGAALTASAAALQRALSHYGGSLGNADPRPLVNALADGWLGHGASVAARRAAPFSANPVYFVMMDLGPADAIKKGHGSEAATDEVPQTSEDLADFLERLQPKPGPPARASSGSWRAARALTLIMEALATHGHPAPARWASAREWRPLSRAGRFRLLLAAQDGVRAQDAPHALLSRLEFWDEQMLSALRLGAITSPPSKVRKLDPVEARRDRWNKMARRAQDVPRGKLIRKKEVEKETKKTQLATPSKILSSYVEIIKDRLRQLEKAIWRELKNLQVALRVMDYKDSARLLPGAVRRAQPKLQTKRPQVVATIQPQQKIPSKPSSTMKQKTSAKRLKSPRDSPVAMDRVTRGMNQKLDICAVNSGNDILKKKLGKPHEHVGNRLLSTHSKGLHDYDFEDTCKIRYDKTRVF